MSQEPSPAYEKPLQTTNQVKANLINANMIKGDMIQIKPGQGRSNSKVTFIQKQVKPNELKNIGLKKTMLVSKEKFAGTKFITTKDGKLLQVPMMKTVSPNTQVSPVKAILTQQPMSQQAVTQQPSTNQDSSIQQQSKTASLISTPTKVKPSDIKREKRKSDSIESISKGEENSAKSVEIKTLDS